MVYPYNGTLFSFIKTGNSHTCYNMGEDTLLSEISKSQKKYAVLFYLYEVLRVVKFRDRYRMVGARAWGRGMRSYFLMGSGFLFCQIKVWRWMVVMAAQQCECT